MLAAAALCCVCGWVASVGGCRVAGSGAGPQAGSAKYQPT